MKKASAGKPTRERKKGRAKERAAFASLASDLPEGSVHIVHLTSAGLRTSDGSVPTGHIIDTLLDGFKSSAQERVTVIVDGREYILQARTLEELAQEPDALEEPYRTAPGTWLRNVSRRPSSTAQLDPQICSRLTNRA